MDLNTIIPVITFAAGLLGKPVYDLWRDNYVEKRQRRKDALKHHFTQLNEKYIKPTSDFLFNVSLQNGVIFTDGNEASSSIDMAEATWPTVDKLLFYCFKQHFPKEAKMLLSLEKDVKKNNEDNNKLNLKIVSLIEEKSKIIVNNFNKKDASNISYFNPFIVTFLRWSLLEFQRTKKSMSNPNSRKYDFRDIVVSPNNVNSSKFDIKLKDGRQFAIVNDPTEVDNCKQTLIEISEDDNLSLRTKVLDLIAGSTKDLLKSLSYDLDNIYDMYLNFGSILKKKNKCPICEKIR